MALLRCALLQLLAASLLVNTSPDSIQLDFPHLERGMVRLCPGGLEARQGINRVAGQDFVEGGSSRLLAALRSGLSGPQLHVVRGGGEDDMDDGEQPGGGGGGAGQKRGMQKRGMRLRTGAKHAAKRACLTTPMEEGGDGSSESESLDAEAEPQMGWVSTGGAQQRGQDEELRVPDHVESAKEAMRVALDHQTVYVRSGEHRWRGDITVDRNKTLHVRGELGSRLWGQWVRRGVPAKVGEDWFCLVLPGGSRGSFAGVTLAHETEGSFDACVTARGGPWMFGHCKVLSNHATALRCSAQGDVLLRRCSLGGLEPADAVDEQVFGGSLARYGVYATDNSTSNLQACVLENNGRTGGIGARFSNSARATLQGCMIRCNDVGVSADQHAAVVVQGCTLQRNPWAAFHIGHDCKTVHLSTEDNTVIGRTWFNARRPGERRPPSLGCCNSMGCEQCFYSISTEAAGAELMARARKLNPDLFPAEDHGGAIELDSDDDGKHTRLVVMEHENGNVTIDEERFSNEEDCMRPPEDFDGEKIFFASGFEKKSPPNGDSLGDGDQPAVAQWWDRCNSHYI